MKITKVQVKQNGFLVNDELFVPQSQDNSDFQEIQKWIASGGVVEPEFTLEERKQNLKNKLITNRKNYLASTDWYIAREADKPNSYPQQIKDKRILAREEINDIEAATTLTALNQFDEIFQY